MANSRLQAVSVAVLALAATGALAGERVQIISERHIARDWQPDTAFGTPPYPEGVDIGNVCVNIGYHIGKDGVPSDFSYLSAWTDPASSAGKTKQRMDQFGQAAVYELQKHRFVPAKADKAHSVYTSASFAFATRPGTDPVALRKRCAIPDLAVFIEYAQKKGDPASWYQLAWNRDWFKAKNTRIHGLQRE